MATVFQGGYVGGPTSRPIDLSPIQQGLDARNQRLDAIPMAEFERYGPVGLAHKAAVGDESAERFLNRYYGGDTWRRFIPKIEDKEVVNPETGETEMVRGFTPPPGSAWDPQQMQRYSMDYFGFEFPQGGAPAESEQRVVTSDEQVVTAKEKTKGTQPPEQPTPDEVLATTRVHEGASDTAEVAPPVAVRDGASAIDRSGTQDQLMAGSDDVAGALQYKADIVERRAGAAFNETDPAQRTAAMVESEVIPALVEYMATPGRGLAGHEGGNPFAPGGLVDQIVAQRVGEEGISYLDASQPGTWRDAIRNRVRAELSARGLGLSGDPLSPEERATSNPGAATEPTTPAWLTPGPVDPTKIPTGPGTRVDDQSSLSPGARDHNIGAAVGGRTAQAGGDVRTDAAEAPAEIERAVDPQTGRLREAIRIGSEYIEIKNPAQHNTAARVVDFLMSPEDSARWRGAQAALVQTATNVRDEVRPALGEQVKQQSRMVPAGQFAREMSDWIQSDPQSAGVYFQEAAQFVINARSSAVDDAYKQALAGQARATTARTEIETEALEKLGGSEHLYQQAELEKAEAKLRMRRLKTEIDRAEKIFDLEIAGEDSYGLLSQQLRNQFNMSNAEANAAALESLKIEAVRKFLTGLDSLQAEEQVGEDLLFGRATAGDGGLAQFEILIKLMNSKLAGSDPELALALTNMVLYPMTGMSLEREEWGFLENLLKRRLLDREPGFQLGGETGGMSGEPTPTDVDTGMGWSSTYDTDPR